MDAPFCVWLPAGTEVGSVSAVDDRTVLRGAPSLVASMVDGLGGVSNGIRTVVNGLVTVSALVVALVVFTLVTY